MDDLLRNRRALTGLVFVALGFVGLWDGFRLANALRTTVSFDQVGPGGYLMGISGALVIAGLASVVLELRSPANGARPQERRLTWRVPALAAGFALYAALLSAAGYFLATLLFFVIGYAVTQVGPWHRIVLAALVSAAVLYLVFILFADMPLPHGPLTFPGM